jgi:hypothetical protein
MTQPADVQAAPEIQGPVCDLCGQEEAIGSIMSLADYATIKFGPACVLSFLRSYADQIEQAGTDAAPGGPVSDAADPLAADTLEGALAAEAAAQAQPGAESAGRPDPMVSRVVRSTHGHRKGAGSADD